MAFLSPVFMALISASALHITLSFAIAPSFSPRRQFEDHSKSTITISVLSVNKAWWHVLPQLLDVGMAFDYSTLPPLTAQKSSTYLCEPEWMETVLRDINIQMNARDNETFFVSPMAMIGCRGSGKTAALQAVAHRMSKGSQLLPLTVAYVSFCGWGAVTPEDKQDYVRAVLLRIAFTATHDTDGDETTVTLEFRDFQIKHKDCCIDPRCIANCLGDARAILLVDELSRLLEPGEEHSEQAGRLRIFIEDCFLAKDGRYFIFKLIAQLSRSGVFWPRCDCA
jgi:hypothetical protein